MSVSDHVSNRVFDGVRGITNQRRERLQAAYDRQRSRPTILLSDTLERQRNAIALIFEGLVQHYIDCLTAGRLDQWKSAAHASIELFGSIPGVKFVRRSELIESRCPYYAGCQPNNYTRCWENDPSLSPTDS